MYHLQVSYQATRLLFLYLHQADPRVEYGESSVAKRSHVAKDALRQAGSVMDMLLSSLQMAPRHGDRLHHQLSTSRKIPA